MHDPYALSPRARYKIIIAPCMDMNSTPSDYPERKTPRDFNLT